MATNQNNPDIKLPKNVPEDQPEPEKARTVTSSTEIFEVRPGFKNYEVANIRETSGDRQYVLLWSDGAKVYVETIDEEGTKISGGKYSSVRDIQNEAEAKKVFDDEIKKLEGQNLKVNRGLYFTLDYEGNPLITGEDKPKENVVISFTPTTQETDEVNKSSGKIFEHANSVGLSGYFDLDAETMKELKDEGVITDEFTGEDFTTALRIYSSGGKSEDLVKKVDESDFLSDNEKNSFYRSAYIIASLERTETDLTKDLQTAFRVPEVNIHEAKTEIPIPSQIPHITLDREQATPLTPVVKMAAGKASDLAKKQVKKVVVNALKKGGKELAKEGAKVAVKAGVGVATGPVGWIWTAISIVGGAFKWAFSLLPRLLTGEKDSREGTLAIGVLMIAAGLALANTLITAAGGLLAGSSFVSMVGASGAGSQAYSFFRTLLVGVIMLSQPYLTPLIILIFVVFPLFFIFNIFIINNSAFVVPWGAFDVAPPGFVESLYIGVEKEANPPGPFQNNQQITVTYTVTITAKLGSLSNIDITYNCQVYSENPNTCPSVNNIRAGPQGGPLQNYSSFDEVQAAITTISPTEPFVIIYDVTYPAGQYNDSLVTDTFTVAADAEGGIRSQATGAETIIIGDPPTGCFVISDAAYPWPAQYSSNLQAAINTLVSQHPAFTAKVCSGGEVPLCYDPPAVSLWGWHVHASDCDIKFDSGGLTSVQNATYILTHEASHHLQRVMGSLFSAYSASGAPSELPICTYSATSSTGEGFAEGNALYVQLPSFWSSRCGAGNTFQGLYPLHYNFADQVVFQ